MAQLRGPEVEAAATAAEFARNLRRLVEWKINVGSIVPMVRRGGLRKSSKDSSNQRADVCSSAAGELMHFIIWIILG